jgi:hypothetical protein
MLKLKAEEANSREGPRSGRRRSACSVPVEAVTVRPRPAQYWARASFRLRRCISIWLAQGRVANPVFSNTAIVRVQTPKHRISASSIRLGAARSQGRRSGGSQAARAAAVAECSRYVRPQTASGEGRARHGLGPHSGDTQAELGLIESYGHSLVVIHSSSRSTTPRKRT